MYTSRGAQGWEVSVGEDLGHPWAFWQWRHLQIQQGVIQGQLRNLKFLQASGAGHWDSHSPRHLSMPRSGHRIKLSLYSFLPCPGLSPTHPQLAPCQQGAMPSGGARSSGHRPQSRLGRLWEAPQGCEGSPGSKSQAWAWAQSQRAHLESSGQGGPTA